jgi:iron(III) transport system substrate-binding protein
MRRITEHRMESWRPHQRSVIITAGLQPIKRKENDLADPKWKGKVCSATPDKSGSAYMQLNNVLLAYKDNGWDVYKKLLANFFISTSSGAVPKFVNDGEAAIGITLEDNAFRYVQGGGPVKIVYPEDGAIAAPDGIAIVKGAPHPDAAKVFVDWCLSKSAQDFLVAKMFRRTVRVDGANPPGLPALSKIKTLPYNFADAARNKDAWVKRFTDMKMELGL